jgi:hypothetical protein
MINTGALGFLRRRKRKPFAQVFEDPAIFGKWSSTGLHSTYERYPILSLTLRCEAVYLLASMFVRSSNSIYHQMRLALAILNMYVLCCLEAIQVMWRFTPKIVREAAAVMHPHG